jgi:hypothetical protein
MQEGKFGLGERGLAAGWRRWLEQRQLVHGGEG